MSDEQKPEARWGTFAHDERDVAHFAFTQAARRILDDAMANQLPSPILDSAAGTFLILSSLSRQLDLVAGRPAPNADGAMIVAAMIASGEAPLAAGLEIRRDYSGARGPLSDEAIVGGLLNVEFAKPLAYDRCEGDVNACSYECAEEGCQA